MNKAKKRKQKRERLRVIQKRIATILEGKKVSIPKNEEEAIVGYVYRIGWKKVEGKKNYTIMLAQAKDDSDPLYMEEITLRGGEILRTKILE